MLEALPGYCAMFEDSFPEYREHTLHKVSLEVPLSVFQEIDFFITELDSEDKWQAAAYTGTYRSATFRGVSDELDSVCWVWDAGHLETYVDCVYTTLAVIPGVLEDRTYCLTALWDGGLLSTTCGDPKLRKIAKLETETRTLLELPKGIGALSRPVFTVDLGLAQERIEMPRSNSGEIPKALARLKRFKKKLGLLKEE